MPLSKLLDKQDIEFKAVVNQTRLILNDMQSDNQKIQNLALRYFDSSESAEKFIHNYQELKLHTVVPFEKR